MRSWLSDPTAWVDFYTEDAIFVGPGMPAARGTGRAPIGRTFGCDLLDGDRRRLRPRRGVTSQRREGVANWVSGRKGLGCPAGTGGGSSWSGAADADGRWRIARELLNEDV